MSALHEKVAAEHMFTSHSKSLPGGRRINGARCSCGHELPWTGRQEAHLSHMFAEHEAAVRAQIAADIEARMGRDADYDDGMEDAAAIARGESR